MSKLKPLGYNLEEIESLAMQGIWLATKGFDPIKSKFDVYANFRVRGYILDCIRTDAPLSRTAVQRGLRVSKFSDSKADISVLVAEGHTKTMWKSTSVEYTQQMIEFVELCFSKLKAQNLNIARLYFIYGFNKTETATRMELSNSTISARLKKIRQTIYTTLIDELPEHSILRTAFLNETTWNEHGGKARYSHAWRFAKNRDCGIFSSVCGQAGGMYNQDPSIFGEQDCMEKHSKGTNVHSKSKG